MNAPGLAILIIGLGPVGQSLAAGLRAAGLKVSAERRLAAPDSADVADAQTDAADVVILAVRDDAIAAVAAAVVAAGRAGPDTVLLHCAGSRPPLQVLAAQTQVAGRGLLHPLRSLATAIPAEAWAGTVMGVCGDERGVAVAQALALALRAHPLLLTEAQLPAYHAAAVLAAGQVAALLSVAIEVLQAVGLPRREAEQALGALCRGVAENVIARGLPAALTGPAARGDVDTVAQHLRTLPQIHPQAATLYRALLPAALRLAAQRGAAPPALAQMAALLTQGAARDDAATPADDPPKQQSAGPLAGQG